MIQDITFFNEDTDVARMNVLLEELCSKRFIAVNVFTAAVRAVAELHGILLPLLDVEGADGQDQAGPTVADGKFVQAGITDAANVNMYAPPFEGTWVFNVISGAALDAPSDIYLYMIAEREDDGIYGCYAQLVDGDELQDLLSTDNLDDEFPELVGDVAGETPWDEQQRHVGNSTGNNWDEVDVGPPTN